MSGWDWFDDFERSARLAGDAERNRLGQLHREAYRHRESDPDHALALLAEGRRLAERLGEPWWVLYYDQQRVHALLHFKQDYREVLPLAVRNTLEVRKPAYEGFPRQLLIHGDLVSAYLGIDPVGYAEPVRQALEYLEGATPAICDERYLLLGNWRQFAVEMGRLDEALQLGQRSLVLAADDPLPGRARHFLVFTYSGLAEIAFRLGDRELLDESAQCGEEMARRVGHQVELAGFQRWQALAARQDGHEADARTLHRQAVARLDRLRMPPDPSYRDAECAFHEAGGDLEAALQVRQAELRSIEGRGRLAYESACHLKRGELLARLGRLTEGDVEAARQSAGRLRQPGPALAALERLGRDQGGARA
jgi:hypothetical protein